MALANAFRGDQIVIGVPLRIRNMRRREPLRLAGRVFAVPFHHRSRSLPAFLQLALLPPNHGQLALEPVMCDRPSHRFAPFRANKRTGASVRTMRLSSPPLHADVRRKCSSRSEPESRSCPPAL